MFSTYLSHDWLLNSLPLVSLSAYSMLDGKVDVIIGPTEVLKSEVCTVIMNTGSDDRWMWDVIVNRYKEWWSIDVEFEP